jgi:hypothetical protein
VDTNSDEPAESLRQHSNVAPDDGQAAAQAGIYITKEELEEATKNATTEALMAITETLIAEKKQDRNQASKETDKTTQEVPLNKPLNNPPHVGGRYEHNTQQQRGGINQNGHQNVVDNKYRNNNGPQQHNNQNYYNPSNNNEMRRETRTCYHCNEPGHLMANCRRRMSNSSYNNNQNENANRPRNQNFQ